MRKIDKLIRLKLAQHANDRRLEAGSTCPSNNELAGYAANTLDAAGKKTIENHIADCFLCLDKAVSAYEGKRLLGKRRIRKTAARVAWKAKNIYRISDELLQDKIDACLSENKTFVRTEKLLTTEKAVIKWLPKNLKKNKWLIASITSFVLSFAFPPVFLQFLLAAGILGGKWIFDSENTRTLIMIYNAWKKGGEKEAGEMLRSLKDRLPK
ncbi:MAG: hypothetical protein PHO42_02505 [Candidatus Omnitrophica bacterium]|nr:hypothetical protein [Candidatus Omnitrophota bacterium]